MDNVGADENKINSSDSNSSIPGISDFLGNESMFPTKKLKKLTSATFASGFKLSANTEEFFKLKNWKGKKRD